MSGQAQGRVLDYYRLVDAGDVAALVALFRPDAVYQRPGYPDMVGRTAIERFYRGERLIRQGAHRLAAVLTDGGMVAVHGTFAGVLHDDTTVSLDFADFFTVGPDARFARRTTFFYAPLV